MICTRRFEKKLHTALANVNGNYERLLLRLGLYFPSFAFSGKAESTTVKGLGDLGIQFFPTSRVIKYAVE